MRPVSIRLPVDSAAAAGLVERWRERARLAIVGRWADRVPSCALLALCARGELERVYFVAERHSTALARAGMLAWFAGFDPIEARADQACRRALAMKPRRLAPLLALLPRIDPRAEKAVSGATMRDLPASLVLTLRAGRPVPDNLEAQLDKYFDEREIVAIASWGALRLEEEGHAERAASLTETARQAAERAGYLDLPLTGFHVMRLPAERLPELRRGNFDRVSIAFAAARAGLPVEFEEIGGASALAIANPRDARVRAYFEKLPLEEIETRWEEGLYDDEQLFAGLIGHAVLATADDGGAVESTILRALKSAHIEAGRSIGALARALAGAPDEKRLERAKAKLAPALEEFLARGGDPALVSRVEICLRRVADFGGRTFVRGVLERIEHALGSLEVFGRRLPDVLVLAAGRSQEAAARELSYAPPDARLIGALAEDGHLAEACRRLGPLLAEEITLLELENVAPAVAALDPALAEEAPGMLAETLRSLPGA